MEQDIKILENYLDKNDHKLVSIKRLEFLEAIEHLIKAYKELEEKVMQKDLEIIGVEEYTKASMGEIIENYYTANKDCIPTSKIKEKIEELNKKEQELQNSISSKEREEYSDANISFELMDIEIRRSVLQELLERRK